MGRRPARCWRAATSTFCRRPEPGRLPLPRCGGGACPGLGTGDPRRCEVVLRNRDVEVGAHAIDLAGHLDFLPPSFGGILRIHRPLPLWSIAMHLTGSNSGGWFGWKVSTRSAEAADIRRTSLFLSRALRPSGIFAFPVHEPKCRLSARPFYANKTAGLEALDLPGAEPSINLRFGCRQVRRCKVIPIGTWGPSPSFHVSRPHSIGWHSNPTVLVSKHVMTEKTFARAYPPVNVTHYLLEPG